MRLGDSSQIPKFLCPQVPKRGRDSAASSSTVRGLSCRPHHYRVASLNHPRTLQSSTLYSSRGLNLKTIQQKKLPALRLPPLWFPVHKERQRLRSQQQSER